MTIMATTTSVRTAGIATYIEPVSLSQIFVDFLNGVALKKVDVKIELLQSRLNDSAMDAHYRRPALIREEIAKLEAERLFIARTMSAQLS